MPVRDRVLIFALSITLWGGLLGITLFTGHTIANNMAAAGHGK